MTALVATLMWRNRRACRGERMSGKFQLSDITKYPPKCPKKPPQTPIPPPYSPVGEPKFPGFKALCGRGEHNLRIPIHNLPDEWRRNFPDSRIISRTALQDAPAFDPRA